MFKYGYYSYKKRIDSFQEAFINPLGHMMQYFMMDECALLNFKISTPIYCHYKAWKSEDISTPVFILGELSV